MLWAACCLGFFGFLRAGEFTKNSSFDHSIHLAVSDVQADALVDPTCFRVHIKSSKTDPFRIGCVIYVGSGNSSICPVVVLGNFLALRGPSAGPLFCFADGRPLTLQQLSSQCSLFYTHQDIRLLTQVTASGLVYWITSSRLQASGQVLLTNSISAHLLAY